MRLYTKDHTWVLADGKRARIGISDFAQAELGDIAYVELPEKGRRLARGDVACTVDSLKSSSEIYAPVSGVVVETNTLLTSEEHSGLVNREPLAGGWLLVIEMSDPSELDLLLPESDYEKYVRGD